MTAPLALYVVFERVRAHLVVCIVFALLLGDRCDVALVGGMNEAQGGRNTRLRAFSFNDRRVTRVNQPVGKILNVTGGGDVGILLLPDATRFVAPPRWEGANPLLAGPKRGGWTRGREGK